MFRVDWSKIAWHCTRDWMVLIIKTAACLSAELLEKIQVDDSKIKSLGLPGGFKKKLEELNKEVKEYNDYLLDSKLTKLKKDVKKFSMEKVSPYIKEDYIAKPTDSDNDNSTSGSESSGSDRGDDRQSYPRKNRGGRPRGSFSNPWQTFSHYPPQPLHPFHPQLMGH